MRGVTYIINIPNTLLGIDVLLEDLDYLLPALGEEDDGGAGELEGLGVVGGGRFGEDGALGYVSYVLNVDKERGGEEEREGKMRTMGEVRW